MTTSTELIYFENCHEIIINFITLISLQRQKQKVPLHTYDSSLDPPVSCFFQFQNSYFHLGITFISITLFTYFNFYMCDFILQIFKDLDRMCSNKLQISSRQKMSKREQERKIKAVREQINTLKLTVTKLESCLRALKEDPDQYFQNLNSKNREYVDWKKRNVKSEKNKENKSPNEEEEEDRGATTTSTGAADNFGFFQTMLGFFHSSATSVPTWGGSQSSSSSYEHTAPGY